MHEKGIDLLKALEVFVAVAESNSMTAAAESLHITQSAVSQYVKQLERELDLNLLDRGVRPIRLTAAGVLLRSLGVKLLHDVAEVRSSMRRLGTQEVSELRLAVVGSFLGTLVPDLVTAIRDRMNIKRIAVLRGMASDMDQMLKRREVDLLISSNPLLDNEGLERYELFSEPYVLLLPPGLALQSPSLAELAETLPLIRYSKTSRTGRSVETHLRRIRLTIPDTLEFSANEDVVAMVTAGHGWTILTPSQVLKGILRVDQRARIVPLPRPGFRRTTTLVVRSGELDPLSRQLADLCCDVIRTTYLPRLLALAPWLGDAVQVGETAWADAV